MQEGDNWSRESSGYSKLLFKGRVGLFNFVNINEKTEMVLLNNDEK